jgi:hypothetical protein
MMVSNSDRNVSQQIGGLPLPQRLVSEWQRALAGEQEVQALWQIVEGGEWRWRHDGLRVRRNASEWLGLGWEGWSGELAMQLGNFMIEVTVSGKAEAAGLSFGPYKDFLAPLAAPDVPRRLQLEVDVGTGCWAFRVDGQLMPRCWWDSAAGSVTDLINGKLTLKAKQVEEVVFRDLTMRLFNASCQLSVIMTCYRFLQRLRLSLRNWCCQESPSGAYELLVVNPRSPDGTHEHLAAVARSYPHVRVREIPVSAALAMNKGAMINQAAQSCRGEWVWLTDADCLFPPNSVAEALKQVAGRPQHLFYGQRRYLTATMTDALLTGRVDGLHEFDELARAQSPRAPENAPWGYTQIVHRSTFTRVRYREDLNHFAHSDGIFTQDCLRHGITPRQIEGLFCLHLDHPFSWYGTDAFL